MFRLIESCLAGPRGSRGSVRYRQNSSRADMAPSVSPGSAATVLSFLALAGLQLETRFRVGEVRATESFRGHLRRHIRPVRGVGGRPLAYAVQQGRARAGWELCFA